MFFVTVVSEDCYIVSDARYMKVIGEVIDGRLLTSDENGLPITIAPPL
jgi:hypothetical protein